MSPESLTVEQSIRQFVVSNFLFGDASRPLEANESFLASGIVDSTGILELVGFLEQTFGIKIEDDELVPDNLDSISVASSFVMRRLSGRA
jgi:acyl carrier protein